MAASTRTTGISSITGKIVYVRHATDWDRAMLKHMLGEKERGLLAVPQSRIVVAVMEDEIIGFGVLERRNGSKACVLVKEFGRRRGVGPLIANHLFERDLDAEIFSVTEFGGMQTGASGRLQRYYCVAPAGKC